MIPLKNKHLIAVVICFMATMMAYSQSPVPMLPRDSALVLQNIISYHIRYAVEGDLSVGSDGMLNPFSKSIFQKLMPVDGQLETEITPYNGALLYPDRDYQLFAVHLPGFKTIHPNGMSTTVRLHAFRFDDDYLIAYNRKNTTIKYISGNFFKSPVTRDFELDINRPESFFPYLELRCYSMQPGHISFLRKDEKGLYFNVYTNFLNIDVEVFVSYDNHEKVNVTDRRLSGMVQQ
ncbi:hypothetical protein ACTJJB_06390 [Chitinophaga sp. 22536]|uniref:hypothetical protein n=1 Tax=unclassified Chitinophaga TaxID=2619133 RepID=UPI003F861D34